MSTLEEWTAAVCRELGITDLVDADDATTLVLDLARDVAHGVARPAAPLTAFLVGLAAGRTGDPAPAAVDAAGRVRRLVEQWSAEPQ